MRRSLVVIFLLLGPAGGSWAIDPLGQVEQDQASDTRSSDNIFNRNLALNTSRNYTRASSYKAGGFAFYAHDGDTKTAWVVAAEEDRAVLEISWGLAQLIDQIAIREKNPAGILTLTLEVFDGTDWETLGPNDPTARGEYQFSVRPASGLRITIETDGKAAGITEVEVFNTSTPVPLARYGSPALIAAMRASNAVILFDGSPYCYSRAGRTLINPRIAEAAYGDDWSNDVLACIGMRLGGQVDVAAAEQVEVKLNGQAFIPRSENPVREQIRTLADEVGLEVLTRGPLVMVGQGLAALDQEPLATELEVMLSQNHGCVRGFSSEQAGYSGQSDAIVTPTLTPTGVTYQWAGFRTTAFPATNIDAWLKYAETKAVRTWVSATRYMSMYIRPQDPIESPADFERCKALVRANPETNSIVAMRPFLNKHHESLTAEFATYRTLGISVINETGAKNWPDTIHDDFINWASCYALTYYLAKNFCVEAHQYGNEPDWYFDQSTDEQIRRRLTLMADAVHSAIDDVNRDYGSNLQAVFSAPVLAGDFQGRSARIMMRSLQTTYDGRQAKKPLFQLFNRHRYSGRPHQNALEVRQAKQMMLEEAGSVLPQVFTELNYATGRHWARPTTTFTNDTPEVFTSIASIWGAMMQEQGVHGIFVFKLNDPDIWSWHDTGRFSNTVTYSMHREQDADVAPKALEQISYGTKNFEVCRLFAKGFHHTRPLFQTDIECSDLEYRAWTASDEASQRFYIWSVQTNEVEEYELAFDLSALGLPAGALITAETVSGGRHGEVTQVLTLPKSRRVQISQVPLSAMLLTIHAQPLTRQTLAPVADATVIQGDAAATNFGEEPWLCVGRQTSEAGTPASQVSFLKFELPEGGNAIRRAVLTLYGQSTATHAYDGGFLFRVYAVPETGWEEMLLTAETAPNLCRTVSAVKTVDLEHFPVGHATCFREPATVSVDVTQAVEDARADGRREVSLMLIREIYWPGEHTNEVSAVFSSREAGPERAPALHCWQ